VRKLIIVFFLLMYVSFNLKAQPITNDTVVCFIDTAKTYVQYRTNPFERDPSCHWLVSIKGHYYDISKPHEKDFASIVFWADNMRNVHGPNFKGPFLIKVPKGSLKKRFIFATEEWINQQTDLQTLGLKIGFYPFSKYNFIVFKHDFDESKNDSVVMHRVQIGYSEVQE